MPVLTSVLFCEGVLDWSLLMHVCFVLVIQEWSLISCSLCQACFDLSMFACLDHSCQSCFDCLVIGNFRLVHVRLALSCSTSFYSSSTAWSTSQWTACKTNGDVWKIKSSSHTSLSSWRQQRWQDHRDLLPSDQGGERPQEWSVPRFLRPAWGLLRWTRGRAARCWRRCWRRPRGFFLRKGCRQGLAYG